MPPWFRIPLSLELGEGWRGIRNDEFEGFVALVDEILAGMLVETAS